jgi:uncharacterized protein YbcI
MAPEGSGLDGSGLTLAISAAIVDLYTQFYKPARATGTTYINDNIVVCVLENNVTVAEDAPIAGGADAEAIDARVAFQTHTKDEFTAAVERLTHCRAVAFLSSSQTAPGVACELFFLDAPVLAVVPEEAT